MKSKEKIAFGILFLFALFGVLILGNIIHENSHRWDYRHINKTNEETCYLTFKGGAIGYYSFRTNEMEETNKISKWTEYKAYALGTLIFIIFAIALYIMLSYIMDQHFRIEYLKSKFLN